MIAIQDMQIIGLVYDMAGISIMGIPAMYRMSKELAAQMGTYLDFNIPLGRALAENRIDVSVGSILLLAGFILQVLGVLDYVFLEPFGSVFSVFLCAFMAIYLSVGRRRISRFLYELAVKEFQKNVEEQRRNSEV